MAKSSKQNYSLDTKKKIITATISELDEVEKEIVQMYINAGYVLHKGKNNPWNKKSIPSWLEKYVSKEESEKFKTILACESDKKYYKKGVSLGWVDGRAEFFNKYTEEKRKELEDKKKEDKEDKE